MVKWYEDPGYIGDGLIRTEEEAQREYLNRKAMLESAGINYEDPGAPQPMDTGAEGTVYGFETGISDPKRFGLVKSTQTEFATFLNELRAKMPGTTTEQWDAAIEEFYQQSLWTGGNDKSVEKMRGESYSYEANPLAMARTVAAKVADKSGVAAPEVAPEFIDKWNDITDKRHTQMQAAGENMPDWLGPLVVATAAVGGMTMLPAYTAGAAPIASGAGGAGMVSAIGGELAPTELAAINAAEASAAAGGVAMGASIPSQTGGWLVGTQGMFGTTGSAIGDAALNAGLRGAMTSAATGQDAGKGFIAGAVGGGFGDFIGGGTDYGSVMAKGAVSGLTGAALNDKDLLKGALGGALGAGAGKLASDLMGNTLGKTGSSTAAGALSGAVNAAVTGGDVGRAALGGGFSGFVSGLGQDLGLGSEVSGALGKVAATGLNAYLNTRDQDTAPSVSYTPKTQTTPSTTTQTTTTEPTTQNYGYTPTATVTTPSTATTTTPTTAGKAWSGSAGMLMKPTQYERSNDPWVTGASTEGFSFFNR
jgi:hypothetical protein